MAGLWQCLRCGYRFEDSAGYQQHLDACDSES